MNTYCIVVVTLQVAAGVRAAIRKNPDDLGSAIGSLLLLLPVAGRIWGWW